MDEAEASKTGEPNVMSARMPSVPEMQVGEAHVPRMAVMACMCVMKTPTMGESGGGCKAKKRGTYNQTNNQRILLQA